MAQTEAPSADTDMAIREEDFCIVPVSAIRPAKENREFVRDEAFEALVESIRLYGVLTPLLVRPIADGDAEKAVDDALAYELIGGERRWHAAGELKLADVPVIVLDYTADADRLGVMWTENHARKDLSTMEKARHVGHLADQKLSQRDIAGLLGISQPQVSKLSSLLKLPLRAQYWANTGELTQDDAVKLAGLPKETQEELCKERCPHEWQITTAVRRLRGDKAVAAAKKDVEKKGWTILDRSPWDYPDTNLEGSTDPAGLCETRVDPWGALAHVDPKAHEKEPCHAVHIRRAGTGASVTPACTDPSRHPRPKGWKADEPADGSDTARRLERRAEQAKESNEREKAYQALQARIAAICDPVVDLCRKAVETASCDGYQDTALNYAARRLLETHEVWEALDVAAKVLDVEVANRWNADEDLAAAITHPAAAEDVGFRTVYAWGLAVGLDQLHDVVHGLTQQATPDEDEESDVKELLAHLHDMTDVELTWDEVVGSLIPNPDSPRITFALKRKRYHATCSVCAEVVGHNTTPELATELARAHLDEKHGGAGEIEEP